jgi:hypothetical protein
MIMKKVSKILILALSAGVFFTSCNKDDSTTNAEPGFSKLTVEQNKQGIEDAAIAFVQETSGLVDVQAAAAVDQLTSLTPAKSGVDALGLIKVIAGLNDGTNGKNVNAFLKAGSPDLAGAIDSLEGVYTWNSSTQVFDKTSASNSITYLFPFDAASTTNDCEFKVTIATVAVDGSVTGITLAPSLIEGALKIKGTSAATYKVTAAYDAKGIPTNFQATITVDTYKWQYTVARSASAASMDFLFAHGSKTLVNYGGEIGGNLNFDDIQAFVEENQAADSLVAGQITEGGTYVQNVKMYFQVMTVKIVETANTKELAKVIDDLNTAIDNGSKTEAEAQDLIVAEVNKNVSVYIMFTDNNSKIADGEMYLNTIIDPYSQEDRTEPAMRFVFGDGTKADMNSYFETGFEDFQTEMETMVTDMQNAFGVSQPVK